jgi:DNA polymerase-3 subunit epsilon
MQYARFRAEGLPIGSGVIESAVRRIVNLRLKGTSMFWHPENAEGILYLRCQIKSGRWHSFFKSVLAQWSADMSISLTQVRQVRNQIATNFLESHPPMCIANSRDEVTKWAHNLLGAGDALIIDTETTGLNDGDEVIQLAIIDLSGNVLLDSLLRPTVSVSPEAQAIHGISDQDLANAPTFCDFYGIIAQLICNRYVVAYNADFDRRVLVQTCARYRLPEFETARWDCIMEKYASFRGELRDNNDFKWQSLTAACIQQGIIVNRTHEAVEDCLLTLELIKTMAGAAEEA